MNTFEYTERPGLHAGSGACRPCADRWKLVYNDPQALVFMRTPPPGVQPLNSLDVLTHMEDECGMHIDHEPDATRCARSLGQIFAKVGDFARARKWIGFYLDARIRPTPRRKQAYRQMLNAGH